MTRAVFPAALIVLASAGGALAEDGIPAGTLIYDAVPAVDVSVPVSVEAAPLSSEPLFDLGLASQVEATPIIAAEPFAIPVTETVPATQSQASVRSGEPLGVLPAGTVDPGAVVPPVDLAPGETVVQMIAVTPSIVNVPAAQPVIQPTAFAAPIAIEPEHQPVIDPVSGRLRDTPGWTGSTAGAAGVGCFPEGACASLNN